MDGKKSLVLLRYIVLVDIRLFQVLCCDSSSVHPFKDNKNNWDNDNDDMADVCGCLIGSSLWVERPGLRDQGHY